MTISAANTVPVFHHRQQLVTDDLMRLQQPCVIFEHHGTDSDGVDFYVYTVGGWLDGAPLQDGCTVRGEVILVNASSRDEADLMAGMGLEDTINALHGEAQAYIDAHAALARLQSVSPLERLDLATKPDSDRSEAFEADTAAIRPLIGDDVMLTVGNQGAAQ